MSSAPSHALSSSTPPPQPVLEPTAFDAAVATGSRRSATQASWRRHPLLMVRRWVRRPPPAPTHPATTSRGELLQRLRDLPIGMWSYGWETAEVRHLGPMAQDFWAAFGLGTSDRRIDLGDATGICMATICELADRIDELEARVAELDAHIAERTAGS